MIFNVHGQFSRWKAGEKREKKDQKNQQKQLDLSASHYLFMLICFSNDTSRRSFTTVNESSLLLMINVQTVHKYTIKERLSVCDCTTDSTAICNTTEKHVSPHWHVVNAHAKPHGKQMMFHAVINSCFHMSYRSNENMFGDGGWRGKWVFVLLFVMLMLPVLFPSDAVYLPLTHMFCSLPQMYDRRTR